mmetsp:Transcript_2941/g.4836  ORF Transcript_2941/g.4836 Transcript_2941/m.4836 type:complete len:230 (-) Transcript_2941:400-1089(-)
MYSDISILIMASSESNMNSDRAFANSVFPTPVGPKKIIDAIGLEGSFIPALFLWIASVTMSIASSCPTTRSFNLSAIVRTRSRSVDSNFVDGIPVHTLITFAISSGMTSSRNKRSPVFIDSTPPSSSFCRASSNCSSNSGSSPYLSSAALFKSYSLSAFSISNFTAAIFSCISFAPSTTAFSDCQRAFNCDCSSYIAIKSASKYCNLCMSVSSPFFSTSDLILNLSISS